MAHPRSASDHQLVIRILKHLSGLQILHRHSLRIRIHGSHLMVSLYRYPAFGKLFRRPGNQFLPLLDMIRNIKRDTTGAKGYLSAFLVNHDFHRIAQKSF